MTILRIFAIFMAIGWLISFALWLYTMINRNRREDSDFIYPLVAMYFFHLALLLIALFKTMEGG
jgi:uncharacterized membrane protein